jgi:hypothetical protein
MANVRSVNVSPDADWNSTTWLAGYHACEEKCRCITFPRAVTYPSLALTGEEKAAILTTYDRALPVTHTYDWTTPRQACR